MPDVHGLHRCPVCFKGYKRREHLQRHRGTHNADRPHRCILCSASFQRTDVLKRHLQSCDGTPAPASGRRRACDRCVRQKKACNSQQPCENCERRAVACQYSTGLVPAPVPAPGAGAVPGGAASASTSASASGPDPSGLPVGPVPPLASPASADAEGTTSAAKLPDVPTPVSVPTISNTTTTPHLDFGTSHGGHDIALLTSAPQPAAHNYDTLMPSSPGLPMPHYLPFEEHLHHHQPSAQDWFSGLAHPDEIEVDSVEADRHSSPGSESRGHSFEFLYDFTSRTGLVSSFECATLEQRQQIVSAFDHTYLAGQQSMAMMTPSPCLASDLSSLPLGYADMSAPAFAPLPYWLHDPLVLKLQNIVLLITNVVTMRAKNSTVTLTWSPALEQRCLQFFSPYRFSKFIELYWSVWHPNVNIVHRPTFNPATAKCVLLAAMALLGACVSPDPDDNEEARMWFNCVEEMVFTDDDFCSDVEPSAETNPPLNTLAGWRKLQALQASYVVCLYQNWEGVDASKRRIRRHRFSTVVSVARDIGIETAKHLDYGAMSFHEFSWQEFVVREQLIRTFTWIFLLDTAFVIFNNLPHRMVIKEMKMHLACPEPCFQAPTPQDCFAQIGAITGPSTPFCRLLLRDAIEHVCTDELTAESQETLARLGPLNLFAIVSAFHYMIFQQQNFLGVAGQLDHIRTGLQNWIAIWDRYFDDWLSSPQGAYSETCLSPDTMWKRVGFVRFSPEYWLLGILLLDRISATAEHARQKASGRGMLENRMDCGGGARGKSIEPILDKYDQTSMRQVNDLITDFQRFHVG
ncbi:hypothetical protein QBC39DRAFT_262799 [Podospora conica]|nr:hypothetical protein QBC39DRAFT_262799 [Schizothecium conicum]